MSSGEVYGNKSVRITLSFNKSDIVSNGMVVVFFLKNNNFLHVARSMQQRKMLSLVGVLPLSCSHLHELFHHTGRI